MVTIMVGSLVVQDPSWGGPGALPVPVGPWAKARRGRRRRAQHEGVREAQTEGAPHLSLSLFGLVEISMTRRIT